MYPDIKKTCNCDEGEKKGSLMLSCDEPNGKVINMSTEGVMRYNAMQIDMAQLYLFGSRETINIMNDLLLGSKIMKI